MPPKRADDAERRRALQNESGELRQYVVSRLRRVEAANMAGSHLLGIATQSIRSLEVLIRNLLKYYLDACDFEYDRDVRPRLDFKKDLDELTLGQVINCFRAFNTQLSQRSRVRIPELKSLQGDLFRESLDRKLAVVTTTRKRLQHYNAPALRDKTRDLLITIHDILAEPMFNPL